MWRSPMVGMEFGFMIIAGIVGHQGRGKTANLINSILALTGKKVSVIQSKSLGGLNPRLVRDYLGELERNHTDLLVILFDLLNGDDEFFSGIHFDMIVYTDISHDLTGAEKESHRKMIRRIFSLMDEKSVAIVNLDEEDTLKLLDGLGGSVITYGFNSKASVTTSSVGDPVFNGSFICCLQNTISAKDGHLVEPQEYRLNIRQDDIDRHSLLAAASFAIFSGIDLNSLDGMSDS